MHIAWSEQDQAYLVVLPEWAQHLLNQIAVTYGATYEEAARNGQEMIEMLIENAQARGESLPPPHLIEHAEDESDEDTDAISDKHEVSQR